MRKEAFWDEYSERFSEKMSPKELPFTPFSIPDIEEWIARKAHSIKVTLDYDLNIQLAERI